MLGWAWVAFHPPVGLHVPQQYATIQDALAHAAPGETIWVDARQGPYVGSIELATDGVTLVSRWGRARLVTDTTQPVVTVRATGVRLQGFSLQGRGTGLLLEGAQQATVEDNWIEGNKGIGVFVFGGADNRLIANRIKDNLHGIWLSEGASQNLLRDNTLADHPGVGLTLGNAHDNDVTGNRIEHNALGGIHVLGGRRNLLAKNHLRLNDSAAVILSDFSSGNVVEENVLEENTLGIWLHQVSQNELRGNTVTDSAQAAILLEAAERNTVCGNRLEGNANGVRLSDASFNRVRSNRIEANGVGMLVLGASLENEVSLNNFLGNVQAGLVNQSASALSAPDNFWGVGGPEGEVTGIVTATPWRTSETEMRCQGD